MEFMIYEKKDTTALITINRPKALNAFNSQMLDELTEALEMAEKDTGVRCVILTAAGERAFTAGGDIKEEVQLNETTAAEFSRRGKKMIRSILNHRVPVICAVRGYALGGGMEMILAADITVAATDAKIGIPTIKLSRSFFADSSIHALRFLSLLLRLLSFDFSLCILLAQAGQYFDIPELGTYSTPHTVQFLGFNAVHRFVGVICNSPTKPMNL